MGFATDIENWSCPVCLDLLYKPCALRCGHLMCLWCMHFSMSPFADSKCPLCREQYAHLPGVCTMLHNFLQKAFPDQYRRRARETAGDEAKYGVLSVEPAAPVQTSIDGSCNESSAEPEQEHNWRQDDFACSCHCSPSSFTEQKQHVPVSPVVLNCGHVHCGLSTLAGLHKCTPPWDVLETCAKCQAPVIASPAALPQLERLLQDLFPQQQAVRMAELQASTWLPTVRGSSASALPLGQEHGSLQQLAATLASGPCTRAGPPTHPPSRGLATLTHSVLDAGAPGAPDSDSGANLASAFTDRFVHYRIGCDSCGVFPIVGKRYKCADCPEGIGYDLCGPCHDSQRSFPGRFNQQHRPEHKMELVHNAPSLLHILQATNPSMDPEQLRDMVAMGTDDGSHAEALHRLLEQPLPSATTLPASALAQSGSSSGSGRRTFGRRRRASSPEDDQADSGEEANPPRRRRRNNTEALVCIFTPTGEAGEGPQVAVAVYARPAEDAGAPSDASGPHISDASEPSTSGGQGAVQGAASAQHGSGPWASSAEQIAAALVGSRQQQQPQQQASEPRSNPMHGGAPTVPTSSRQNSRQPMLRRFWSWATRRSSSQQPH